MTWSDFATLVAVSVTAGIVTAFLAKTWNLRYQPRLTTIETVASHLRRRT